jgi:hypothetical protein
MYTENTPVDNCRKCKEIKDLTAGFPYRGVSVFSLTLFVEAVDLGDLSGFVIATDEGYPIGVSGGLKRDQHLSGRANSSRSMCECSWGVFAQSRVSGGYELGFQTHQ